MSDMNEDALAQFRAQIETQLADLDAQDGRGAEAQGIVTLDQQSVGRLSRMDALQSQAMAQATQARRHALRAGLQLALQRIDDGEFGYCEDCGEDIAPRRLALDPTARRCISCASG